jgi:spermidine synthase
MAHFREIEDDISRDYQLADGGKLVKFYSGKADIIIGDTKKFGPMLFMDGVLQLSTSDEYIYHEMLVHPVMSTVESPKRVCILGGADGCAIREVLRHSSVKHVDLVDWDTKLIEYLKVNGRVWHQGSLYDSRVHIHNLNVTEFVSTDKYDVVIVDLFDPEYKDFNEDGFWSNLFPILNNFRDRGASIVINGGGILPWKIGTFERLYTSAASLMFEYMIPYKVFVPSFTEEWGFILMSDKPVSLKENLQFRYCCPLTFEKASFWEKPYRAFSKN